MDKHELIVELMLLIEVPKGETFKEDDSEADKENKGEVDNIVKAEAPPNTIKATA